MWISCAEIDLLWASPKDSKPSFCPESHLRRDEGIRNNAIQSAQGLTTCHTGTSDMHRPDLDEPNPDEPDLYQYPPPPARDAQGVDSLVPTDPLQPVPELDDLEITSQFGSTTEWAGSPQGYVQQDSTAYGPSEIWNR